LVRRMLVAVSLLSLTGVLATGCASKSGSGSSASGSGSGGLYGNSYNATTTTAAASGSGASTTTSGSSGRYGYGSGSGTSGSVSASASGTKVTINNFAFGPLTLKVKVGQKVTWTDAQMGIKHTVTADSGAFNHLLTPGTSYSFTFMKAGTYAYHCNIHPTMHGTVVVS